MTTEHGIQSAYYALKAIRRHGAYRPQLACLCGFTTDNYYEEWKEAGAAFDDHLVLARIAVEALR